MAYCQKSTPKSAVIMYRFVLVIVSHKVVSSMKDNNPFVNTYRTSTSKLHVLLSFVRV